MTIFGVFFSGGEMFLFGIVGSLSLALIGVYAKNSIDRRQKASEEFISAFDGVILNLRENPDCPIAQFTYAFHNEHLAAIVKFRNSIPAWKFWKRKSFDRATENYKETYEMAQDYGSVFAVALSEKTEVAKEKRKIYSDAIDKLLSHA